LYVPRGGDRPPAAEEKTGVKAAQRVIHVTSVGSSAATEVERLGVGGIGPMRELIEQAVGPRYRVTIAGRIITRAVNLRQGGRTDDAERAADIERALADDRVAALVCLRGGAWFVRVLPRIRFDVLRRRRRRIFIFGFSEMTALVGVAGAYPACVGLYDLCPGYLFGGMRRYAELNAPRLAKGMGIRAEEYPAFAAGWAAAQYRAKFLEFFRDVVDIVEGRGSSRRPTGHVLQGRIPTRGRITIVGGNLSLIESMLGSPYRTCFETRRRWLAIEEVDESPDRFDRMMAGLQLAGLFERAEGILLGDFHDPSGDLGEVALAVLRHHLPTDRTVPIVRLRDFGHVWPMSPLPLHREVTLVTSRGPGGRQRAHIDIPWADWV